MRRKIGSHGCLLVFEIIDIAQLRLDWRMHRIMRQRKRKRFTRIVRNRIRNKTNCLIRHAIGDVFTRNWGNSAIVGIVHIRQFKGVSAGGMHILDREIRRWRRPGMTRCDTHIITLRVRPTCGLITKRIASKRRVRR